MPLNCLGSSWWILLLKMHKICPKIFLGLRPDPGCRWGLRPEPPINFKGWNDHLEAISIDTEHENQGVVKSMVYIYNYSNIIACNCYLGEAIVI